MILHSSTCADFIQQTAAENPGLIAQGENDVAAAQLRHDKLLPYLVINNLNTLLAFSILPCILTFIGMYACAARVVYIFTPVGVVVCNVDTARTARAARA